MLAYSETVITIPANDVMQTINGALTVISSEPHPEERVSSTSATAKRLALPRALWMRSATPVVSDLGYDVESAGAAEAMP